MGWADSWIAVDTETTGFGADARIIEIGVERFEQGEPVHSWSTLLYPAGVNWESKGVQGALSVNGLTRADLVGKPLFAQVYPELLEVMKGPVWVAHNMEFDFRMLQQECNWFGRTALLQIPEHAFCTMLLAYQVEPELENYKLGTVAKRWRIEQKQAHRALGDAHTAGRILAEIFGDASLPQNDNEMVMLFRSAIFNWSRRRRPGREA